MPQVICPIHPLLEEGSPLRVLHHAGSAFRQPRYIRPAKLHGRILRNQVPRSGRN